MPAAKAAAKAKPDTARSETAKPKMTAKTVTEQLIREIAHRLWVEEGHPDGRAEDHWFRAQEIAAAKATIATKKAAAKAEALAAAGTKPAVRNGKGAGTGKGAGKAA